MARRATNGHGKSVARQAHNLSGVMAGAGAVINDTLHSVVDATRMEGEKAVTLARDTVKARPLASLAAAFGTGALIAFLVSRRSASHRSEDSAE